MAPQYPLDYARARVVNLGGNCHQAKLLEINGLFFAPHCEKPAHHEGSKDNYERTRRNKRSTAPHINLILSGNQHYGANLVDPELRHCHAARLHFGPIVVEQAEKDRNDETYEVGVGVRICEI